MPPDFVSAYQLEGSMDFNGAFDRECHRAVIHVNPVDPLDHFALRLRSTQLIEYVDPPDHQNIIF